MKRLIVLRGFRGCLCRLLPSLGACGATTAAAWALERALYPRRQWATLRYVRTALGDLRASLRDVRTLWMWHRIRALLGRYEGLRVGESLLRCALRGRLLACVRDDDLDSGMHLPRLRKRKVRLWRRWLRPVRHAVTIRWVSIWL